MKICNNPIRIRQFLWVAGLLALSFQVIKAITTGFWLDEAWISRPIHSYLEGHGWQRAISNPGEVFRGVYFDNEVISNGPSILVPALIFSLLLGSINPPVLHLFIVSHLLLVYISFKNIKLSNALDAICIFLILLVLTPKISSTHFLGECPGAFWLLLGFSLIANALEDSSKKNSLWLGGIALGLALLAKLIFIIAIIPTLFFLLFRKWKQPLWMLKLAAAIIIPIFFWHVYQFIHVGGWVHYLEVQSRHFQFVSNPLMGSGVGSAKTIGQMWSDFLELSLSGPAFPITLLCLCLSVKQLEHRRSPKNLWFLFSWMAAVAGLLWWVVLSNFEFHGQGAIIRHSTGFVCVGLACASVYIYDALRLMRTQHKLNEVMRNYVMVVAVISFSIMIFTGSYRYLIRDKGYGIYSSWKEQEQLAGWINRYGSSGRLLPIFNCDPELSGALAASHITFPQEVLSSGLFKVYSCETSEMVRLASEDFIVILNGESGKINMRNLGLILKEGNAHKGGVWRLYE